MITASIVVYKPDLTELSTCLKCIKASSLVTHIDIVDNSSLDSVKAFLEDHYPDAEYIGSSNVGYGAGNNLSIKRTIELNRSPYHLVMNSDITFEPHVLETLVDKLTKDSSIGLIMPAVTNGDGTPQSCCHPLPSPLDLLKHRFVPRRLMKRWRQRYDIIPTRETGDINVSYMHGCFMLFRVEGFKKVGLFDERFFMYPEDIDITRRFHEIYKTIVTPDVSIYHLHRGASRRSLRMLWIHAVNMVRYFNKWGWLFDKERKKSRQSYK